MSKLPSVRPKKLLQILQRNGFYVHHQKGSHVVLKNRKDLSKRVTIPLHNKDLKIKTLLSIIRQAGLSKQNILKR